MGISRNSFSGKATVLSWLSWSQVTEPYTDLRERKSEGSGERSQKSRGRTGEQVGRRAGFASNVLLHSLPASFSSSVTN